jgi:hypothetical protein
MNTTETVERVRAVQPVVCCVKHYEQGIKEGGTLLGVQPRSEEDASYFEREWSKAGAEHVYR